MMDDYPCNECLVTAICNKQCYKVFDFMNKTADLFAHLQVSMEEETKYRTTTPYYVIHQIQELVKYDKRFAYPDYIELYWHERIDANRWGGL